MKATYTLDEALNSIGFGKFQWTLLLLSGLGFFATTIELICISLLRIPLLAYWPRLENNQFAWLMSFTFVGELLGGLAWGLVSDRLGRRWTFRGTALMAATFALLGAVSPCFHLLVATRFLLGLAIGNSIENDGRLISILCRWKFGH